MHALPEITLDRLIELLPSAFVIAFLAGVESLLSAMVADRMIAGSHRPMPRCWRRASPTSVPPCSAACPPPAPLPAPPPISARAAARRPMPIAGIVHALVILLVMMTVAPLAGYLAMPALAGLLILTARYMSEPHRWHSYMDGRLQDKVLLVTTLLLTVLVDLTVAIAVGVAFGHAIRMRNRKVPPSDWTPPER